MVRKCAKFTLLLCVLGARVLKTISLPADFLLSSASRLEKERKKGVTPLYLPAIPLSVVQTMALRLDGGGWNQCLAFSPKLLHYVPLEASAVMRPGSPRGVQIRMPPYVLCLPEQ